MEWTKEQQEAIATKDCNLLVAAGAGSGKTAVLVERILHKILVEGIDIDRLLVVTFTNAAASEMRERVAKRMYEEVERRPELQKQISLLGKANIMTIHAFCLRIIRDHFFEVDCDPNVRVGDATECELLKLDALEEMLEEEYEKEEEPFEELVSCYAADQVKDDKLRNAILKMHRFMQSHPSPEDWLQKQIEELALAQTVPMEKTTWGKYLLQRWQLELKQSREELQICAEEIQEIPEAQNYVLSLQEDILALRALEDGATTWDATYQKLQLFSFGRLKPVRGLDEEIKNRVTTTRNAIKDCIAKDWKEKIFVADSASLQEDFVILHRQMQELGRLVMDFDRQYAKKKKEKNCIDFSDIEHMALQILREKEEACQAYRDQFEEILIDEYQDSNMIQETILKAISKQRTFLVGDVKQSIYRFRQARPDLFLEKYESYTQHEDGVTSPAENQKILLFQNFRSNQNIIHATNTFFAKVMSKEVGEIEYNETEYLRFGATYYPEKGTPPEIHIIETSPQESDETIWKEEDMPEEKAQGEGFIIAKRIQELVGKTQVYDKEQKAMRPAEYRDIVILMRSTVGIIESIVTELMLAGIPAYADHTGGYFHRTEVEIIVALLKIIDNPIQDIPLLAVLRSQIGNFSVEELSEIRLIDRKTSYYEAMQHYLSQGNALAEKILAFFQQLSRWREMAKDKSLRELLRNLYEETGYYDYISLFPDGNQRRANLDLLVERAEAYEKTSFKGLFHFLTYIDHMKENSGDVEGCKLIGEKENVVRLMSIHKSKGLEFPIVFLAGVAKKFNQREWTDPVLFHTDLGIGADVIQYDKRISYPNMSKLAVIRKSKEEAMAEEMRILYVAMTRAREKLILTASVSNLEATMKKYQSSLTQYAIANATSFFDWIMIGKPSNWSVEEHPFHDWMTEKQEKENFLQNVVQDLSWEKENDRVKEIEEQMSWQYEHQLATGIPSKISITELKRYHSSEDHNEEISLQEMPRFLAEKTPTGTSYGTEIHTILQKLDFKSEDMEKQVETIVTERTNDATLQSAMMKAIHRFLSSSLYQEMKQAGYLYREVSFNLNLSASEVYGIESDEDIMIQGIIDVYWQDADGNLRLVDYKTDAAKEEIELLHRYQVQLTLYRRALEEITGKKVAKTAIYSFALGKEILVPLEKE